MYSLLLKACVTAWKTANKTVKPRKKTCYLISENSSVEKLLIIKL